MTRDFVKELKERLKRAAEEPKPIEAVVTERLYNIHKVTLPGMVVKKVWMFLPKEEAFMRLGQLIEKEKKRRQAVRDDHDNDVAMGVLPRTRMYKEVHEYSLVPVDAPAAQQSPYWNAKPTTRES